MTPSDTTADDGHYVEGWPVAELLPLLSVPQADFVAARNQRVKALKADRQRELAASLSKLRKPSRLVWVVGEVARRDPDLAAEAVAAAEAAEAATAGTGDIRSGLEQFRQVVARASSVGSEVDAGTDRATVELALREVLSDVTARQDWARGCLLTMPSERPGPPDELAPRRARRAAEKAASAVAERTGRGGRTDQNGTRSGSGGDAEDAETAENAETANERKARRAAVKALDARRRERDKALRKARTELDRSEDGLAEATEIRDDLHDALEAVEAELAKLEKRADVTRRKLDDADADIGVAEERLAAARATVEVIENELDEIEMEAQDLRRG